MVEPTTITTTGMGLLSPGGTRDASNQLALEETWKVILITSVSVQNLMYYISSVLVA